MNWMWSVYVLKYSLWQCFMENYKRVSPFEEKKFLQRINRDIL